MKIKLVDNVNECTLHEFNVKGGLEEAAQHALKKTFGSLRAAQSFYNNKLGADVTSVQELINKVLTIAWETPDGDMSYEVGNNITMVAVDHYDVENW